MTTSDELEGKESCATPDVQHVKRAPRREEELEDTFPGGAFPGSAYAMTKLFIEVGRAPIPMGRYLSFDDTRGLPMIGGLARTHCSENDMSMGDALMPRVRA
jgi:hypothetical protein